MTIKQLLMNIKNKDFNMELELQVKKYLPIEEKKLIAQGIIYECTSEENGVVKLDSIQQYLSYVKYMITRHTNLEYTYADYDVLCGTAYGESNILNAILDCFGADAQECSRLLNLMLDDKMRENSIEYSVGKLFNEIESTFSALVNQLNGTLEGVDTQKLSALLDKYK